MAIGREKFTAIDGVKMCAGASPAHIRQLDGEISLPEAHVAFLQQANGMLAYWGYYRLFGAGCTDCIELRWWNDPDTWRFAWPDALSRFYFIGEDAWGDQYAYDRSSLATGDDSVYILDSFEMVSEQIAGSFEEFLEKEFLRCARAPYDSKLLEAAGVVGELGWNDHITYIPSLILGGSEDVNNVTKINARASMIINGDIASQVDIDETRDVSALENHIDEQGRLRTRVVWRN